MTRDLPPSSDHPASQIRERRAARQRKLSVHRIAKELEQTALEPVLPGEQAAWCRSVASPLGELLAVWAGRHADQHALRRRISERDAVMAYRVATLAERARRHQAELQELRAAVGRIADAPGAESSHRLDETRHLRSSLLYWTVAVRALERELDTWLVELPDQPKACAG